MGTKAWPRALPGRLLTVLVLTLATLALIVWWGYGHNPTEPNPAGTPSRHPTPTLTSDGHR